MEILNKQINDIFIQHSGDLKSLFFDREKYENIIADIGKKIKINNDEDLKEFNNKLDELFKKNINDKKEVYEIISLLLIGETVYRSNHFDLEIFKTNIFDKIEKLLEKSSYYNDISDFLYYIETLIDYAKIDKISKYKDLFKKLDKKMDDKKTSDELKKHPGLINIYCESVAYYFENDFDALLEDESKEILKEAIERINLAIKIDDYHKFYLTLGRLNTLNEEFDEGIENIKKAISKVTMDGNRDNVIKNYQQFIILNTTIKAFFLTNNKIATVKKIEFNSIKVLSVLSAILAVILGEIQVIANADTMKEMFILLFSYASVIVSLLGIALLGIDFLISKRKIKNMVLAFIFDLILFLGGLGAAITLFIIHK